MLLSKLAGESNNACEVVPTSELLQFIVLVANKKPNYEGLFEHKANNEDLKLRLGLVK